ncbi:MAG TPA: DUF4349 domain-containing protein [Candidatus Methylacidiphilales bacterium]|nr:DUF4349 domain-containing protein [Candidatus Methylacidiphilales bacterium]
MKRFQSRPQDEPSAAVPPHDPLDDLMAAALHGEITAAERAELDSRLANDPAARAAYQEIQIMHDLLEKTHAGAQPDSGFEQRMVSGVRRKIADDQRPRETAWQSLVFLWTAVNRFFRRGRAWQYGTACLVVFVTAYSVLIVAGNNVKSVFTTISSQLAQAQSTSHPTQIDVSTYNGTVITHSSDVGLISGLGGAALVQNSGGSIITAGRGTANGQIISQTLAHAPRQTPSFPPVVVATSTAPASTTIMSGGGTTTLTGANTYLDETTVTAGDVTLTPYGGKPLSSTPVPQPLKQGKSWIHYGKPLSSAPVPQPTPNTSFYGIKESEMKSEDRIITENEPSTGTAGVTFAQAKALLPTDDAPIEFRNGSQRLIIQNNPPPVSGAPEPPVPSSTPSGESGKAAGAPAANDDLSRKLIRDASLELEVKSFQAAMDEITALTKAAGGYVDSNNSERGGNGKLQGAIVVKVLPQNLDAFLYKLRDLGELKNQTLSTEDVTKDYVDTQARLDNDHRMDAQLQELLKRDTSKISDLLQVERELARVRGDIEQMEGQLKLYDFEVQYATVTMQVREKDLNQAAAYLLKEQDSFSLLATDVEAAFKQARQVAESCKAQVLAANLVHNSGSDVSANLNVRVPPDQIDSFLEQIRALGRVANFTRETQRVARDGGDSDQPADQTLTEKDKVEVQITIGSDNESRKQVALTVVTPAVDDAFDQAKSAALAAAGTEILNSSLNNAQGGQSTGALSVRVPGKSYRALLDSFRALGRTSSFVLQRDDDAGPGAGGEDAPVIVNLSLTDDETPLQQTQLAVLGQDVDSQEQQLKQEAASSGVEIKSSSFERQPSGIETAQMTFRLPMAKYPAFLDVLKKLGKMESFTVYRNDRPDQARTDGTAPAQIDLILHNEGDIVAPDNGLWATLRHMFSDGAQALFGSVWVIGVAVAFLVPWLITLGILAWVARRIYVWRKGA